MRTHELLGEDCMSFADVFLKIATKQIKTDFENEEAIILDHLDMAHRFLTQPLTPEWVEKYLDVTIDGSWIWLDNNDSAIMLRNDAYHFYSSGQHIYIKNPSHLFESLPPEIKLKYKNVEI